MTGGRSLRHSTGRLARPAAARQGPLAVVLADAHPVVRVGLRHLLERDGRMQVVGEAGDGVTLLHLVTTLHPALVVLDVALPEVNGIDATRAMRRAHPQPRVVVLSEHATEEAVLGAIEAGAAGYLLKSAAGEEIERAVQEVAGGLGYFSPAVAQLLAREVTGGGQRLPHLSSREREIVQMLSEGNRLGEIASKLFISVPTVKSHRANAMRKVGARTSTELIRYALRHGFGSL